MTAQETYIAAQLNVFALEREADTIRLARVALEEQVDSLNNQLLDLTAEVERRKDAATAAWEAWHMVETARKTPEPEG